MNLHPLSVPFRIIETVLNVGWIAIFVGIGVFSVLEGIMAVVVVGAILISGVVLISAWQIAYYRRYEFVVTPETFDITSGVLSRREREIPYSRIQNITINRNVFQRALGLAELRIETAGGGSSEARLRYVGTDTATTLQDEIGDRKRTADSPATSKPPETGAADRQPLEQLYEITTRDLAILGAVSLDARFLFVVLFGASAVLPQLGDRLLATGIFAAPLTLAGLYLATALISAIYSITSYYGFRLARDREELRYERGLLQRYSGTIPLGKIQTMTITENVLARAVGYASLRVETAGYSPGETGGTQSAIPIAPRERVTTLLTELQSVAMPEFTRPPKRARRRYAGRYVLALVFLTAGAYGLTEVTSLGVPWYWPLFALPLAPIAAHLKWRHRGYAVTDEHIITRNGFWNRTITIVPYDRLQVAFDSQTIFQRRWQLATLTIDTAGAQSLMGTTSKAVDIDVSTADRLRETTVERLFAVLETPDHDSANTDAVGK